MIDTLFRRPPVLAKHNLDWEQLVEESAAESLLPCLKHQLSTLSEQPSIPPDIASVLSAAESLNDERNRALLAEAVNAATLLNRVGIQPVALKGLSYLLLDVYPTAACRYLADIDLLVSADDLDKAVEQLKAHHYFESDAANFPLFKHHHPALRRQGLPHIEIHSQIGLGICNRLLPASAIISNSICTTFGGASFLVPSPTDLVNHLIIHSQFHHSYRDRLFPPLRAFVDLAQLCHRFGDQVDWSAIAKAYQKRGESATLTLHMREARRILQFPTPPPIPTCLSGVLALRYKRREFLRRHPRLRLIDPAYIFMSLFSRRLRLVPLVLRTPSSWPRVIRLFFLPSFYSNLFRS